VGESDWWIYSSTRVIENSSLNYSPLVHSNSSCTGLSVFLVAAYRSVGIPARVAGVPHWLKGPSICPDGDESPDCGNHNWGERNYDVVSVLFTFSASLSLSHSHSH
jgi:hypothetical protein